MKVFRDLRIMGTPEQLEGLLKNVEESLTAGWNRNIETEKLMVFRVPLKSYCFTCDARDGRKEGSLHLMRSDEEMLQVSNIIPPAGKAHLSYDEYNRILDDFHSRFIEPLAKKHNVGVWLSNPDVDMTEWLTDETAKKLQAFSSAANKRTGSSHPDDQKRWHAFLVAAHEEKTTLTPDSLERWLKEEEGWDEDQSWKLAINYESARLLLEYYDSNKGA